MGYKLDEYQKNAVECNDRNSLIVAAPGSGKTTVIINRVNYLVNTRGVSNHNLIIITFTKSAALNMKKRYIDTFNVTRTPFFGTFHGLFYKMLLNSGRNIDIIDSNIAYKIVNAVLSKYFDEVNEDKIKETINNISVFKTSRMTLEEFKPSITKDVFCEALEHYENYKKENSKLDFDDLALQALDLLKNNENILNGYRKLFKFMLVDEFQDCDEIQIEFLKMINKGNNNSLFAVGDEDQCIYSFRGSKPEYMVTFDKIFKDGMKHYLSINYRSRSNIVEKSKDVIKFNKERNVKEIKYNKEEKGIVKWFNPYNEKMQGEIIADIIEEKSKLNISYENNAILYRTNMESNSIIDILTRRKIPFTLIDREYNFFEHFICKDIIAYLRLSINEFDRESFLRIINKPFRYVSKTNLSYVKNYTAQDNPFDILAQKSDIQPFQKKKMNELKDDVRYLNKISLSSAIAYIIMDLEYIDYLKNYSTKYNQSFDDLEDIVEEFKLAAEGYKTILEFLRHVEEVKESIEESKKKKDREGVILSTIHGVKGMEFKNVFVINVCEETIPHASSAEVNLEEERRLFYVGITRAIDELYIISPRNRRGQFKDVSRFIVESKINDLPVDTYGYKKGGKLNHRTYGNGIIKELDKDKITVLFDDNMERNFSLKVLVDNNLIKQID